MSHRLRSFGLLVVPCALVVLGASALAATAPACAAGCSVVGPICHPELKRRVSRSSYLLVILNVARRP